MEELRILLLVHAQNGCDRNSADMVNFLIPLMGLGLCREVVNRD